MNQRISLYLSGQYPGNYRLPNRLEILLKIRQLDQSNFNDTTINLLQGKSDGEYFGTLLSAFESLHTVEEYKKLLDILSIPEGVRKDPYEGNCGQDVKTQEKKNPSLQLNQYLHNSIISIYSEGIKSKLYDGAFIEAYKIINDRLEKYCNEDLGKGRRVEMDAVNTIFDECKNENTFNFKRVTETEQGMEVGLKGIFEGTIKYFRNPAAHIKDSIKTEKEFIEAMFMISMLLNKMDDSKIK